MRFRRLLLAGLVAAAFPVEQRLWAAEPGESGKPDLAVYRWSAANPKGGAKANEAFARWMNLDMVWAEDFEPNEHWKDNIEGGGWQLGEWSKWKKAMPGRRLILSVPLLPGPWDRSGPKDGAEAGHAVSLDVGAKGAYNQHFRTLAENLVKYDLADSVLRLGWEFNGGWYAWRAGESPKAFAAYWRKIVETMRATPGAKGLKFCWNPALGWQQFPSATAWPGDDVVDIVGLDVYDESWATDTYPWPSGASTAAIEARRKKVWDEVLFGGQMGLKFWNDFSVKHGKPFAVPEWGVSHRQDQKTERGGLDNPYFIEQMHAFLTNKANNIAFHCYFDVQAGDGHHQLSPGIHRDQVTEFPRSAARFQKLFGNKP